MATKNIVRLAKEFVVKVSGMVIARCTDFSMSVNKEVVDITSFDSDGWDEFLGDSKNWTISFSSLVTRDFGTACHDNTGLGSGTYANLFDHLASAGSDYGATVGIGDSDGPSGGYWEGCGILQGLDFDGAVKGAITYSGNVQGTGKLTRNV